MNSDNSVDRQATTASPDVQPATPEQPAATSDRHQARLRRVDEYEKKGLKDLNPSAACLAVLQSDLMRTAFVTGPRMLAELTNIQPSPEGARLAERAMNIHLRLAKQIERFCGIHQRRIEASQKARLLAAKLGPLSRGIDDPWQFISPTDDHLAPRTDSSSPPYAAPTPSDQAVAQQQTPWPTSNHEQSLA